MRMYLPAVLACSLAATAGDAHAQDTRSEAAPQGVVALGAGVVPEFDGSDDMRVLPAVLADIRWHGLDLQLGGQGLRVDVVADRRFAFGPMIGVRLPRKDVEGPVGLLSEIDTAVEAGAFVGYRLGGDDRGQGSLQMTLSAVHDVSGAHDGLLATASLSYAAIRTEDFSLSLDAQTSWANRDYARTYFGVTPGQATASGLAAYAPGAGFKDIGAGLAAGYWFSRRFGVMGRAGVNYLVGDLADSPVAEEGSRWQTAAAIALAYRF